MRKEFTFLFICFFVERIIKLGVVYSRNYNLNTSVSLGLANLSNRDMIAIMIPISLILAVYWKYSRIFAINLILLGSISNLIDRVIYGGVVDFLPFLRLFSFNIADVYIFAGIILLIINKFNAAQKFSS